MQGCVEELETKLENWSNNMEGTSMSDVIKILSIDGGGIRGLIPAVVLAEIEKRTGKPASELFDLIAGTSTGGILALGLTCPAADGRPRYSAERLIDLYQKEGNRIFNRSRWRRFFKLDRVGDYLQLIVKDDGVGFNREQTRRGMGLMSMQERAESVGGLFQLNSKPGTGVELRVMFPIERLALSG